MTFIDTNRTEIENDPRRDNASLNLHFLNQFGSLKNDFFYWSCV